MNINKLYYILELNLPVHAFRIFLLLPVLGFHELFRQNSIEPLHVTTNVALCKLTCGIDNAPLNLWTLLDDSFSVGGWRVVEFSAEARVTDKSGLMFATFENNHWHMLVVGFFLRIDPTGETSVLPGNKNDVVAFDWNVVLKLHSLSADSVKEKEIVKLAFGAKTIHDRHSYVISDRIQFVVRSTVDEGNHQLQMHTKTK